jgi:formate dehydrogenase alpha subunit
VTGLATKFGSGAMTNSVDEIVDTDAMLVIGSNTTENHPIIALKMKEAVAKGSQLIVADPRKIPLVKFATLWLRHRPGTDSVLLNSIAHVILKEGLEDRSFVETRTENFESFAKSLESFTPEFAEEITGVPAQDIIKAAKIYGSAGRAGIYYAMGITQHVMGTNNVNAVGNLAMLTGNLGKHGAGVNPLRGQNNVQGACDMGALPNVYPGYQKVDDPSVREKFEKVWGCTLSDKVGTPASIMTDQMIDGTLKGLYIFGENPAVSDPNMGHSVKAFKSLDFLVVQDLFLTETAKLADVVLPGASFAEKEGTFTCSERRVQRIRKAINPLGEAKSDLEIIDQIFKRVIGDTGLEKSPDPSTVFDEVASLWSHLAGMDYERIADGGLQWPCPDKDHPGTKFMYKEKFSTESGKALFWEVPYVKSDELPDEKYPFILTTGRELFHYHTGTMTRRSTGLNAIAPEPFVEVNPTDASKLGVVNGERIVVCSRRGEISLKARVSMIVPPGVVFIPFHYTEAAANLLTNNAMDPVCKIMEAKVCAVQLARISEK